MLLILICLILLLIMSLKIYCKLLKNEHKEFNIVEPKQLTIEIIEQDLFFNSIIPVFNINDYIDCTVKAKGSVQININDNININKK